MKKYFIGVDESYDVKTNGNFILCFFIIKNEKDYTFLANSIEKILIDENIDEMKNNKSSNRLIEKYLKKLKNIDYKYYLYAENIKTHKEIRKYYENGIEKFVRKINNEYKNEKIHLDIKLDNFGGLKTNNYFIKILNNNFKTFRHNSKYQNSKSSIVIQYADIFAGENRKLFLKNKTKNNILEKNKILL